MKIAIHDRKGSFSDHWIEYCKKNDIEYKIVNAYDSDIVEQVKDCDAFMWHHHQTNYKDVLFAKQLLFSLQQAGKIVFPDLNTGWHFDDKLGQKYLFEAHGIKAARSWAFYDKKSAYRWIEETSFPKVFKLRGGAGSANVMLAKSASDAKKFVRKAFKKGFPQYRGKDYVKESYRQYKANHKTLLAFLRSCGRLIIPNQFTRMHGPEKGYVYFQEFIPNEGCDYRVTIVGEKAIAFKRLTRKNDFRASASGLPIWEDKLVDIDIIKQAFQTSKKLKTQTISIDIVFSQKNYEPYIIEVSFGYGFPQIAGENQPNSPNGFWTSDLVYHIENTFSPIIWMIESVVNEFENK